jgi:hypothetical protein
MKFVLLTSIRSLVHLLDQIKKKKVADWQVQSITSRYYTLFLSARKDNRFPKIIRRKKNDKKILLEISRKWKSNEIFFLAKFWVWIYFFHDNKIWTVNWLLFLLLFCEYLLSNI